MMKVSEFSLYHIKHTLYTKHSEKSLEVVSHVVVVLMNNRSSCSILIQLDVLLVIVVIMCFKSYS